MLIAAYCPTDFYEGCKGHPLLIQNPNQSDVDFMELVRVRFEIESSNDWNTCVVIIDGGNIQKVTMDIPEPKPQFLWHTT